MGVFGKRFGRGCQWRILFVGQTGEIAAAEFARVCPNGVANFLQNSVQFERSF